jgi:fumarate reductase subunit D
MIGRRHLQSGYIAAMIHRLSGLALALFLPMHFLALGSALSGANRLDSFLTITHQPLVKFAEAGLIVALSVHLALGLRLLAMELFAFREKTLATVSLSFAVAFGAGLLFLFRLV